MGTLLGIFGTLKKFFFEIFRKLDPPRNTGQKIFRKICPKTRSKHAWILSGTILCIFGILKKKILKIFENSTLHGTPGLKFFRKNHPKTRLDTFGNDFGHFWNFANFLISLIVFEDSTFHGKLGKNFPKSLPQNTFKTRLDTFGNDFGHFRKFETFFDFFENFRRLDLPWKTGQKFFEKNVPNYNQITFGYFWERFWAFLEF